MNKRVQLNLTPEQWVGLLNKDGAWLPVCCASISAARDVLSGALREGGYLDADGARAILCEVADHDGRPTQGLTAILAGDTSKGTLFWTADGSPWFEIVRACRALLGDGDILAEAREHRRVERAEEIRTGNEATENEARWLARHFHNASAMLSEHTQPEWDEERPSVQKHTTDVFVRLLNLRVVVLR